MQFHARSSVGRVALPDVVAITSAASGLRIPRWHGSGVQQSCPDRPATSRIRWPPADPRNLRRPSLAPAGRQSLSSLLLERVSSCRTRHDNGIRPAGLVAIVQNRARHRQGSCLHPGCGLSIEFESLRQRIRLGTLHGLHRGSRSPICIVREGG